MDTFSHGLWGKGLFGYRGHGKLAILFGTMPDLCSFGLLGIIQLFTKQFSPGPPKIDTIPDWIIFNYDITHSFVTAFICIYIVNKFNKDSKRIAKSRSLLIRAYLVKLGISHNRIKILLEDKKSSVSINEVIINFIEL